MPARARRDLPTDENDPEVSNPWEQGEGGSFGSWLRQQREIRNISLREISDNTKIGMRYLEALEEDRFEVLPAPIFAKGFLREYAKYVGLDADEVVNYYLTAEQRRRAALGIEEPAPTAPAPSRLPSRPATSAPAPGRGLLWAGIALLVVALVALGVWLARRDGGAEEPQAPPPSAPPVSAPIPAPPVPTAPPAQAATGPFVVNLTFTAECWVEAVVDGSRRISELRVQGESMRIEARESVVLTLGNAGSVRVDVNGKPMPLTGAAGQVVRDLVIDRAAAGLPPLPAASPAPGRPGGGR
jgi:cytoskeletal protein RodZ